ncbi:hypothetical protein ACHAWO_002139 [Cyclotella atomus]|uniref:AB hydrolase-1 domain-containing protein n=1 Tax=Cyclotella atomus TaxID=382360 RepID=A0ABD3QQR5_9STRA
MHKSNLILVFLWLCQCHAFVDPNQSVNSSSNRHALILQATPANEGYITIHRDNSQHQLSYRIARPMSLSSKQAAPILTLHGGPSLPSSYLYPLEECIPYRSIIYFDQLGCGKSDEPADSSLYSIENTVHDLHVLIKQLGIRRFHLYGHSYGGILAFEYMKSLVVSEEKNDVECLSAVLSSAPYHISKLERDFDRLTQKLIPDDRTLSDAEVGELFRINHQCRLPEMPAQLARAYANPGTVWFGTQVIADYVAQPPPGDAARMPSTLIMRGEYDFVGEECFDEWKKVINRKFVRCKTLDNCSHHGLYENSALYGETIDSYFAEYD